jgi:hypothetical protein
LVTLGLEKNVNLAHTYTLVGRVRTLLPRPGIEPPRGWIRACWDPVPGSGSWRILGMEQDPEVGVRIPVPEGPEPGPRSGSGIPDPYPGMTIPGSRDHRSQDPGSPMRCSRSVARSLIARRRCKSAKPATRVRRLACGARRTRSDRVLMRDVMRSSENFPSAGSSVGGSRSLAKLANCLRADRVIGDRSSAELVPASPTPTLPYPNYHNIFYNVLCRLWCLYLRVQTRSCVL